MDEREAEILGDDRGYCWFRAKDELIKSLVDTKEFTINIGAGVHDYDYAINYRGLANNIPYLTNLFDTAILGDVIEHIPPKERLESLVETSRVLKPGGKLIVTVPAGQWLYNSHDEFLGHYCRYDKKSLRQEVESAGFKTSNIRYWNSLLYIPFVVHKLFNKNKKPQSDFMKLPPLLNTAIYKTLKLEERINGFPLGITLVGEFENAP